MLTSCSNRYVKGPKEPLSFTSGGSTTLKSITKMFETPSDTSVCIIMRICLYKAFGRLLQGFLKAFKGMVKGFQHKHILGILGSSLCFLQSSGTPNMGSARSNLYVGRWSRACPVGCDPILKPKTGC